MAEKPVVNVRTDSESIISMVLGAMVVIVIGALLFSYVRDWRSKRAEAPADQNQNMSSPAPIVVEELPQASEVQTEKNDKGEEIPTNLPAKYTVKSGDSTWKIAQAFYGSGFNYTDIEAENNLKPNQDLTVGMELTVPKVAVRTAQTAGARPTVVKEEAGKADPQAVGPSKGDDSKAQKAMNE